jgi:hypothetical protein
MITPNVAPGLHLALHPGTGNDVRNPALGDDELLKKEI